MVSYLVLSDRVYWECRSGGYGIYSYSFIKHFSSGLRIYQTPPPSHGLAVLLALNILSAFEDMQAKGEKPAYQTALPASADRSSLSVRYSAEHTHLLVEVMRRAYADAVHFIGMLLLCVGVLLVLVWILRTVRIHTCQ